MKIDPEIRAHLSDEDVAAVGAALSEVLRHPRPTGILVLAEGETPEGAETRYGGSPWMSAEAQWPEWDGAPMTFAAQVNLKDVPGATAEGTVLLFVAEGGAYEEGRTARVLLTTKECAGLRADGPCDPLVRVRVHPMMDYPHWEDLSEFLSVGSQETLDSGLCDDTLRSSDILTEIDDATGALVNTGEIVSRGLTPRAPCFRCDKLGGWPSWEQGNETPRDARGREMRFLAQFRDEQRLGDPEWPETALWGVTLVFASEDLTEFAAVQQCD